MTDNVIQREIQRRDDPFGIPACFYWTIDEVADWVESIGYGKYKENFRSHFINGRKLLTVDACVLPKMGITHFGDILNICRQVCILQSFRRALFSPYVDTSKIYLTPRNIVPYARGPPVPNKAIAGFIRDIQGKGPRVKFWPPAPGARFYGHPQKLQVVQPNGKDVEYNWRYWVPNYHYGYMPKESPVTAADFQARWNFEYQAYKLLGRNHFTLVRPP